DLAEAEDLLAREEAHVAQIDRLMAQLDGLVGKEASELLPTQRDTAALESARDDAANARARVEANAVDAEQVAGQAERLAAWRDQLAATQRRQRVFAATLAAI